MRQHIHQTAGKSYKKFPEEIKKLSIIINTYNRKKYLYELIDSIYRCRLPKNHEIIVIDDASDENYENEFKKKYPEIFFHRNKKTFMLVKSRNIGWKLSKGNIIFFIDDDNEIRDKNFFNILLDDFKKNSNIGVMGCRTYYFNNPEYILSPPNKFNFMTGKTTFLGQNQKDYKKIEEIIPTYDTPNAFVTTREVLNKVNGFSDDIIQTFSEADFCLKVKKLGLKIVQNSKLKVYHKSPFQTQIKITTRQLGNSPRRAYFLLRNRYIIIKRYGNFKDKLFFILFFHWIYPIFYSYIALKEKKFDFLKNIILGCFDGIKYFVSNSLINRYDK